MNRLIRTILEKIYQKLNDFAEDTAEALECGDKLWFFRNVAWAILTMLATMGGTLILLALLYAGRRVFFPMIGIPLVLILLISSYLEEQNKLKVKQKAQETKVMLETRSEALYGYVRDGMFAVFRALSEYTPIIRPSSPSAVETPARYYISDGFAVFQFSALYSDSVDIVELKRDIERVLGQMLRAGELPGLPTKLVAIENRFYTPLQVFSIVDLGSSVNVDIVFANERTVPRIRAKELQRKLPAKKEVPYDEEF